TTTNANETLTNTSLIYGSFVHIDGSSIDSGHSLTFDATGLTGGYLYLQGGGGADTLKAANAYSSVGSGEISNRLFGGGGADTLTGATDLGYADLFIYKTQSQGGDTITNFTSGVDKLAFIKDIDGGDFGFNSTAAARSHVYSNLAAYNAATGETGHSWYLNDTNNQLMYDADGHAGVHTAQTMATLTGVSSIAPTDVIIVDASYNTIA
ncbi:MAG: hypothetical protein Q8S17_14895, partial [Humidesulfovibrio sp.]|nr:hypothetical protein [Humidesulfovibrio sp.]